MSGFKAKASTLCLLLFVFSLALQPILSAKVTRIDDQGRTVLVCTLQGLSVLSLDGKAESTMDCPACTLNSMLGSAALNSDSTWQMFSPQYGFTVSHYEATFSSATSLLPPLRAPPVLALS